MDTENFIAEFKKTFVYDMLSMSLKDEQLFEHVVDGDGVLWFKEQTRQMWSMWQAAKAQAIPDGFVLMPIKPTETMVAAVAKEHEGDAFLPYSLYDAYVKQAMIEAQEPANESE